MVLKPEPIFAAVEDLACQKMTDSEAASHPDVPARGDLHAEESGGTVR